MARKKGKRASKKSLRRRESQLNAALMSFINNYDPSITISNDDDPVSTPEKERQFRILLRLRWLINAFLFLRLKHHPAWRNKQWFLDLFDVDSVAIENDLVILKGDIVWWALGNDAIGNWWPSDHRAYRTGIYKVKIRGDMMQGYWVIEQLTATLQLSRMKKRVANYDLEFGFGNTYLKYSNK